MTAGRDGRAGSGDAVWTGTGTGCNSDLGTTVAPGTTHDLAANARLSGSPIAASLPTDRGAHDPCAMPSSRWRSPPSRSVSPPARPRKPAGPTRRLRPRWRPAAHPRASLEAPRRARGVAGSERGAVGGPSASASAGPASAAPSGSAPASAATGEVVTVTATNITFEQADLEVPADTAFTLELVNNDASVPHNVDIRDQAGTSLFTTDTFPGVETAHSTRPRSQPGLPVRVHRAPEHDHRRQRDLSPDGANGRAAELQRRLCALHGRTRARDRTGRDAAADPRPDGLLPGWRRPARRSGHARAGRRRADLDRHSAHARSAGRSATSSSRSTASSRPRVTRSRSTSIGRVASC